MHLINDVENSPLYLEDTPTIELIHYYSELYITLKPCRTSDERPSQRVKEGVGRSLKGGWPL